MEDIGPISYNLPPLAGPPPVVQQQQQQQQQQQPPLCMEDKNLMNYQEQMQRTGMIGVPPPSNDDSYWTM